MSSIEQSVEIAVPVRTAYDQWTQFEEFPRFMEGVEEVRQIDDTHLHWKTTIAGRAKEFDARITEQVPDERIAWTAEEGAEHAGVVTFHRLDDSRTRVMLQVDVEPEGLAEKAGDALGLVKRRVAGDLERFKAMIEERGPGGETGAWRGEVGRDDAHAGGTVHTPASEGHPDLHGERSTRDLGGPTAAGDAEPQPGTEGGAKD